MNRAGRITFFLASGLALLAVLLWGMRNLPPLGDYRGPYGYVLNSVAVYERHATDVVTAVNFDYRGFDTLGEEFILFISVVGGVLLLRRQKGEDKDGAGEKEDQNSERKSVSLSDAVRVTTIGLVGPVVVFGFYVVSHGQLTPGGGFQGGVILATAPLLVYLGGDFKRFKQITSHTLVELAEAAGALAFLGIGFAGYFFGQAFLQNVFPLGRTGAINSSGTIAAISLATGLEVAGGFVLLLHAFLEQTLEMRLKGER
jgi:multicomponent Na+:H+ antiporter subunit B